jgi:methanogenic corrinoid protein MtbC1
MRHMGAYGQNKLGMDNPAAQKRWSGYEAANVGFGSFPHLAPAAGEEHRKISMLARTIEREIIPRLLLAHRAPSPVGTLSDLPCTKDAATNIEAFAKLCLLPDDVAARAYVETARVCNMSLASIYVNLLGPAARYLGELWEEDLCDFTEVTLGLGRLQQLLHEFSPVHGPQRGINFNGRRILLLPSPGEQHVFGLVMVGELFRHAGWDVAGGPTELTLDLEMLVHREWYDVVGFSVGCDAGFQEVSAAIQVVRKASMNPRVGIMVGGPIFTVHPEYAGQCGEDICSTDGRKAPVLAEKFVSNLEAQSG